ncbi:8-amino-7-oxononanoate synthase [Klebsiella pneumoniae]|uniref:8-amino-7-oxononanoate synthase n=1 Tax=Klebsiella pneumoniae TaxID=573 RepID=A0A377UY92_KLEPN|nr:8-amino-7-oxononanoate synthase [Klebsiella pneumoniae]
MGEVSLGLTDSVSAIQPLIVGDNARALNLACRLRDAGLLGNGDPSTERCRSAARVCA